MANNTATLLGSRNNIASWPSVDRPGGLLLENDVSLTDAAYHQSLRRWAVVGYNGQGDNRDNPVVITSDNIADRDNSWVIRSLPAAANGKRGLAIIYDPVMNGFYLGGNDGLLLFSFDGVNWSEGNLPSTLRNLNLAKFARAPWGGAGASPRVYGMFSGSARIGISASLAGLPPSWSWIDAGVTYAGGPTNTAIAAGNRRVYVTSDETPAQIGYYFQGGAVFIPIGSLAMQVTDMTYGNGRLVAISPTGQIQYVDVSGNAELTVGNWSSVSASINGSFTTKWSIEYDEGDDDGNGYGFIAVGSDGSEFRIYTSPDAVTWTERATLATGAIHGGIGAAYPESNLDTIP